MPTQTKFYCLEQFHHGNKYLANPKIGLGICTIIETFSRENAITRFKKLGIEFNGNECPSCGTKRFLETCITENTKPMTWGDTITYLPEAQHTVYIHLKSGKFTQLHKDAPIAKETANELLQLIHDGVWKAKNGLTFFLQEQTKNKDLKPFKVLEAVQLPSKTVDSRFVQHEVLIEALEEKLINMTEYCRLSKTNMSAKEINNLKDALIRVRYSKRMAEQGPKKRRPTIAPNIWERLRDEAAQQLQADANTWANVATFDNNATFVPPQTIPQPPAEPIIIEPPFEDEDEDDTDDIGTL